MSLCESVWKVTCEVFGVEFVPFDEFDFVGMMKPKAKVWDEIAEQHGLYNINRLEEITCFEALINVLHFGFQHVCSMNKSREFADTLKSLGMWGDKIESDEDHSIKLRSKGSEITLF